ncbi:DUF490 domain-containing protein [Bacteroidia bacterium]|nr:DUF490 domain-containing protein [Bacteroidia bacterium]
MKLKKAIRRTFIVLLIVVGAVGGLLVAAYFAVQHPKVQSFLITEITRTLSSKLNANISIRDVQFRPFNRLRVNDILVQDQRCDTILYAQYAFISLSHISFERRSVDVNRLHIQDAAIVIRTDSTGVSNISQLFKTDTAQHSKSSAFEFFIHRISLENLDFQHIRSGAPATQNINLNRLHVSNVAIEVDNLHTAGDTLYCNIAQLSGDESSGFSINKLSAQVCIAPTFTTIKELQIDDNQSVINIKQLQLQYSSFDDFSDFANKIKLSATLNPSKIDLSTLSFFVPNIQRTTLPIAISGTVQGKINDLNINYLQFKIASKTTASITASVQGLPDVKNAHFNVDVKDLRSTANEMLLLDNVLNINKLQSHKAAIMSIDSIAGSANFAGTIKDFAASVRLASSAGNAVVEGQMRPDKKDSSSHVQGNIIANNIQVGNLLQNKNMGRLNFHGNINGNISSQKDWNMQVKTNISLLEYKNYTHKALQADGTFTANSFQGTFANADTNLLFNGRAHFKFNEPNSQYRFLIDMQRVDLVKLGINTRDSVSQIRFATRGNFSGANIDDILGNIELTDIQYIEDKITRNLATARIEIAAQNNKKRIALSSDIADAELISAIPLSQLSATMDLLLQHNFPNYKNEHTLKIQSTSHTQHNDNCSFWIKMKQMDAVFAFFAPQLDVAEGTILQGNFDNQDVTLKLHSNHITWQNMTMQNVVINANPQIAGVHDIAVDINKLVLGGVKLDSIAGRAHLDTGGMSLEMGYHTALASGKFKSYIRFFVDNGNEKVMTLHIFPSVIALGDTLWNLQQSDFVIGKKNISVSQFRIENQRQFLQVQGNLSAKQADTLDMSFKNIDIVPFLRLTGRNTRLTGMVSGTVSMQNVLKESPLFWTNINVDNFIYDNKEIGNVEVKSFVEVPKNDLNLSVTVTKQSRKTLVATGVLDNEGKLTGEADFDHAELYYLEPLLEGALSKIHGNGTGHARISGTPKHILINGQLDIADCNFVVTYINTTYAAASGTVFYFEDSHLKMKNILVHDVKGNEATLNAEFRNITVPKIFSYDMNIDAKNYQAFNTNELISPIYFGQGFATGNVKMSGVPKKFNISATSKVDKGTALTFVLGEKSQQRAASLINFVSANNTSAKSAVRPSGPPTDVNVDLTFDVPTDADINIMLNPNSGDMLTANGEGSVKLEVQTYKNIFRMFGNYTIKKGEYTVSVQNLLSKKFKIEPGSSINFTGPIENATMSIMANYRLRTSLAELLGDTTSRYKQMLPIDCKILIEGTMNNPNLKFMIEAPTADKEIKDRMQAQLNTNDNVAMQFFSLMLTNRFLPGQNDNNAPQNSGMTAIASTTVGEFFTSIASNFFSQLLNVDLNFNLKPQLDENKFSEASVTVSRDLGERVVFSTTLDYQADRKTIDATNSTVLGNVDLEVLVDKSGKFRIRVFGRTNDQYSEMMSGVANNAGSGGMGIVYQEEFNSFGELWDNMFRRKKKKNRN